jgi:hypothetical protein
MPAQPRKTSTAKKASPKKSAQPAAGAPIEVTPASAWKRKTETVTSFPVTLPSGNVARLRRTLDLPQLLTSGKIPNPLAGVVNEMITSKKPSADMRKVPEKDRIQVVTQMVQLINKQLPKIFVEPVVESQPVHWDEAEQGEWAPNEGALSIDEIDPEDAVFAFQFAQGGPTEVASFREQSAALVADLADGEGVEGASE